MSAKRCDCANHIAFNTFDCQECEALDAPLTVKMVLYALEVMEREGYTKPRFGGLGTVRFTDLLNSALNPRGRAVRETEGRGK